MEAVAIPWISAKFLQLLNKLLSPAMSFIDNSNVAVDTAVEALEYGIMHVLCLQEKHGTKQQYRKTKVIYRY